MQKIFEMLSIDTISEISRDIAQVFFAGMFIEPLLTNTTNAISLISGFGLSVLFWAISIKTPIKE